MATLLRTRPQAAKAATHCHRAFSTTTPRCVSLQIDKNDADALADTVPAYPHGPTRWYKQSRLGLYGGQRIRFGNNVGDKIEVKTRRAWRPNVLTRKLFSKSLNRHVQVRVTTRVLRTIDKLGGLDEYLLGEKEGRVRALGESGWWLRWAIMQTPSIRRRFAAERQRLGIPDEVVEDEQADVAEAQDVIEETSEMDEAEAEAEAAAELGEAVGTDGNFVVEQPPGLPPLKFRVGPGKHLILTASGWRRTRGTNNHTEKARMKEFRKERLNIDQRYLTMMESAFRTNLEERMEKLPPDARLRWKERQAATQAARMMWKAECREESEAVWNQRVEKEAARAEEKVVGQTVRDAARTARRSERREALADAE
ncbi:hypothetical protein B0A50_01177 [Salinomyces thailandicus]|uniref:Large ribosomal subunit protein bL28m n=1 Tax=Salinomyces thailandicus TaxID=706561 RepID=A0A4U0UBV4_9PEZI|nr:hypothetical protein B0A50_01177 [Salinomyces thailandica]